MLGGKSWGLCLRSLLVLRAPPALPCPALVFEAGWQLEWGHSSRVGGFL